MTATTATIPAPSMSRSHNPALWSRLAMLLGGAAIGVTATLIISDTDEAPARTVSSEAQFRDASAAEQGRYVDSLESVSTPAPVEVHTSADAAEHWAVAGASGAAVEPGTYAHGYDYSAEPGDCDRLLPTPC